MRLRDAIQSKFNMPVKLRLGAPGALDIFIDGAQVFSKKQTGRMPSEEEVLGLVKARQ